MAMLTIADTHSLTHPSIIDITIATFTFRGADLTALVREAATSCLKEFMSLSHTSLLVTTPFYHWESDTNLHNIAIYTRHFESAFSKVHPSVSVKVS